MTTCIIQRSSEIREPGERPYVNARLAKASARRYPQGFPGPAVVEQKDVWVTDDDPLTVFNNTGEDVIIGHAGYIDYPVYLEIYDDYRE